MTTTTQSDQNLGWPDPLAATVRGLLLTTDGPWTGTADQLLHTLTTSVTPTDWLPTTPADLTHELHQLTDTLDALGVDAEHDGNTWHLQLTSTTPDDPYSLYYCAVTVLTDDLTDLTPAEVASHHVATVHLLLGIAAQIPQPIGEALHGVLTGLRNDVPTGTPSRNLLPLTALEQLLNDTHGETAR